MKTRIGRLLSFGMAFAALFVLRPSVFLSSVGSFSFTRWEMATVAHGQMLKVPLPPGSNPRLSQEYHLWSPAPDNDWKPAPHPALINFNQTTDAPCEEKIVYFAFRTTLNLPATINPQTVHLIVEQVDDQARVWANGTLTPFPADGPQLGRRDFQIGGQLHPGLNPIQILLGDWYTEATLTGVSITAQTTDGKWITAALEGQAPVIRAAPTPTRPEKPSLPEPTVTFHGESPPTS